MEKGNVYRMPKAKRTLGRQRRSWVEIRRWILKRQNVVIWIRLLWLRTESGGGLF
jgi:hypothetical protein